MARPPSEFHPGMPDCSIATPPRYCVCPIAQLLRSIATRACERSIGAIAVTINRHARFLIWSYHIAVRLELHRCDCYACPIWSTISASFCPFVFFRSPTDAVASFDAPSSGYFSTSLCNPNLLNFLILSASMLTSISSTTDAVASFGAPSCAPSSGYFYLTL